MKFSKSVKLRDVLHFDYEDALLFIILVTITLSIASNCIINNNCIDDRPLTSTVQINNH